MMLSPTKREGGTAGKPVVLPTSTKLVVTINHWQAIASWHWDAKDDSCGICRMPFDSCCSQCSMPEYNLCKLGDACPLVWGECTHVFHLHCIDKWCQTHAQTGNESQCPMCRGVWKEEKPPEVTSSLKQGAVEQAGDMTISSADSSHNTWANGQTSSQMILDDQIGLSLTGVSTHELDDSLGNSSRSTRCVAPPMGRAPPADVGEYSSFVTPPADVANSRPMPTRARRRSSRASASTEAPQTDGHSIVTRIRGIPESVSPTTVDDEL